MTCRAEVLAAARSLSGGTADGTFSIQDVVQTMRTLGTRHTDAEVRLHVSTVMCRNATGKHRLNASFHDLERVSRGRYRLIPPA
ncbi:DUF7669 domain-containing protein [Deinococcus sedimenti]|uniref:DUF7669 domain-containing protein n=1 Tax=Deinococcus sedimenti TaxID=1867090 RepID=A0ABQ2S3I9_9DEIO|nr:hypothetical protein [Deinococcus sedimenti]GGR92719.1 hypothetical protein GCM10008960_19620 [Deinococcus sedimenti]